MNRPEGVDGKDMHSFQPTLLSEVTFAERTSDGVVIHALSRVIGRTSLPRISLGEAGARAEGATVFPGDVG